MKTLTLLFLILSPGFAQVGGCTDPLAYSCEMDTVWTNYIFDIGGTKYDNSCNWDWDLQNNEPVYVGGCETGVCQELLYWEDTENGEGYYNPEAEEDDGSCRYYQAPHGDEVSMTITDDGIVLDWSDFQLPELSDLQYFCVLRCAGEGCLFLPGFQIPDANTGQEAVDTSPWEFDVEIKYAIGVKYSANPYWGWAIDASYITPTAGCTDPEAEFYDPEANVDDGSCTLEVYNTELPDKLTIKSLYPNPFNPQMNIEFEISKFQEIQFKVVDLNGRQFEDKILGSFSPGSYQFTWQPQNINSGMYFISLGNQETAVTKKVVFLK